MCIPGGLLTWILLHAECVLTACSCMIMHLHDSATLVICRMTGHMATTPGQHLTILHLSAHPGRTQMIQFSGPRLGQTLLTSKQTLAPPPAKKKLGAGLPLQQMHLPFHPLALPLKKTLLPFLQKHLQGKVVISLPLMHKHHLPIPGLRLVIQMVVRVKTLQQATSMLRLLSNSAQFRLVKSLGQMLSLRIATFGEHIHWPW